ncbi:MAG: rhodanese-like domain-containing protein [Ruminococcus sp.]|nr:rhodanese-like domain-containing protein [Ruminococcus sp.]
MRRRIALTASASLCLLMCACGNGTSSSEGAQSEVNTTAASAAAAYQQITQEKAKEMMQADDGHIIVDVRRQDEYDSGHIPGAILIPNESIGTECPKELPDLNQIIMIYCRSGRRSKEASHKLADMGYTHIYEFGGIIDWTGEIVTS